jgi:hypothetical protein
MKPLLQKKTNWFKVRAALVQLKIKLSLRPSTSHPLMKKTAARRIAMTLILKNVKRKKSSKRHKRRSMSFTAMKQRKKTLIINATSFRLPKSTT